METDNIGEFSGEDVNWKYTNASSIDPIMKKTKPRVTFGHSGFSLLEILVTIVIFSLGVLALAATQVLNIKGTGFNKDAGVATGLAQKRLEDLKNTTFGSIASNTTGVTERGMNVSWSVTDYGTAPHRYKDVVVTVAWEGKNISCYTVITEP
jgi:prepilin-type N-terminal cleavage/methylation domain-containing protein